MAEISVNELAFESVEDLMDDPGYYNVKVETLPSKATVIDTGVEVKGGVLAGLKVVEICIANLGQAWVEFKPYGELMLPTVSLYTDHPALSLLGSQFAGWNIKVDKYFAVGSGPIRAIALKPKKLYTKINYKDESEIGVLVLESEKKPTDEVAKFVCEKSGVKPENLYMIVTPDKSLAGMVQIAGRIVETGLYRLEQLGLDPLKVITGYGYAPIMSLHPDPTKCMARANDALFYGGVTHYVVDYPDEEKLKEMLEKAPSSTAKDYGKPFYEAYKAAGFDFYKIDTNLFAPAKITVNNLATGNTFTYGEVNPEIVNKSNTT